MQILNFKKKKFIKRILVFTASLVILQFTFSFLILSEAKAHCPLCVAGAGVGLTLSRWIGVDDSITGLWLAAFLGAISFWSYSYVSKKISKINNLLLKPLIYILIFASTLWSFYKFNLIIRMEKMYGLDKLTFGIVVGGVFFYAVELLNDFIIKKNRKSLFPYQRLVTGLGIILILSVIDYILIGYYI